jgi:D-alanine transaminase
MNVLANWNGEQMPLSEVRVSVLDRAFMFGDAVYEVIRIYGGRAWRLKDHIDRLGTGLNEVQIPFNAKIVEERLESLLKSSGLKEALAYVQVTRGCAPRHHYYPKNPQPNCLVYVEQFDDPHEPLRKSGARAVMFPDNRWLRNDIKATTLLANCMAASAARQKDCIEAILVKNGMITEGSHTSVFGVRDNKVIISPAGANVLPGITKKQVLELCATAGIELQEGTVNVSELANLQELFITSTLEEVIGLVQLDDVKIGNGKPGPITVRLQEEFRTAVKQWLELTRQ